MGRAIRRGAFGRGLVAVIRPSAAGNRRATLDIDDSDGTMTGVLRGVGIFQAVLKFTPPVVSAGSLATLVGQSFPANTAITLQWQEPGVAPPLQVISDPAGAFRVSFVIIVGEILGPRHLEPAPNPGVLEEPRPVAPLLIQAPTFRPQGLRSTAGGSTPALSRAADPPSVSLVPHVPRTCIQRREIGEHNARPARWSDLHPYTVRG